MGLFDSSFYNEDDLADAGFKSVGKNVLIDKNCTIIGKKNISIGSNVRIDGYTTIVAAGDGYLNIGSNIHIAGYVYLGCSGGMDLGDFCAISHGSKFYTASDDYTGKALTNPTVPSKYTNVRTGKITLGRHVLVGSMTVVLPGVEIGEGTSVGALSKIVRSLDSWGVYAGSPVERVKERSKNLLELEKQYLEEISNG